MAGGTPFSQNPPLFIRCTVDLSAFHTFFLVT